MATFVISKRLSGDYKYELNSRKGKTIFTSNPFELRYQAEEEIIWLQNNLEKVFFMRFRSPKGKFYCKLILEDKEIAVTRKYSTQLMLDKGINEILRYSQHAEILDFSLEIDSLFG
jgi:uncharacterized protein